MTTIIVALIMGLVGGPAIALAIQSPANCKQHEERRRLFEAGKGRNPDDAIFGPHQGFRRNALRFGLIFALCGAVIGMMAADY